MSDLFDLLQQMRTQEDANKMDRTLDNVASLQVGEWAGYRQGVAYVKIGGKEYPTDTVGGCGLPVGSKVYVRQNKGRRLTTW